MLPRHCIFIDFTTHWSLRWWLAIKYVFSNKVSLTKKCTLFFRHNAMSQLIDYSIVSKELLKALGHQKFMWLCCALLWWSGTRELSGVCVYIQEVSYLHFTSTQHNNNACMVKNGGRRGPACRDYHRAGPREMLSGWVPGGAHNPKFPDSTALQGKLESCGIILLLLQIASYTCITINWNHLTYLLVLVLRNVLQNKKGVAYQTFRKGLTP